MSYCVLNGQFTKDNDEYTCLRPSEQSVVDYICVPYEQLIYITYFKVHLVKHITDRYDIEAIPTSKMPDHSMRICNIELSEWRLNRATETVLQHTNNYEG